MKCQKCNTEYDDSFKFCPNCGQVNQKAVQQGEITTPPPVPPPPVPPPPPRPPTTSTQSKRTPPPPPPPIPPAQLQPLDNKKGGFKKFWSDLPTFGKVLMIAGIIVILVIIGVAAGTGAKKENNSTTTEVSNSESVEQTAPPASTQPTIQQTAPPVATPPPATWQTVIDVTGNADKRTQPFHLGSGQKRLLYNVVGGDMLVCGIYLMPEGVSLDTSGGFPEVTVSQPGSSETAIVKSPGNYYLDVTAANCSWQVTIQEMK